MADFVVSARKYRPDTFDTVVGQSAVTNTLRSAILQSRIAHAYLFCGPRGVGKTTCSRILAKTLNCINRTAEGEACDECSCCKALKEGRAHNVFELDAASNNSVDDIRKLTEQVRVPPAIGKYNIYIIDEVHMLSQAAFNAFLKTLEEPPAHAIFILATTERHKILPTILSRCQIFEFQRIKIDDTVQWLEKIAQKENIPYEKEGLRVIAQKADGGMRDALSMFDQAVSSGQGISYKQVIENLNVLDYECFFKLTDAFLSHHLTEPLAIFNDILDKGFDAHNFLVRLAEHFRDLLVSKDPINLNLLEVSLQEVRNRYLEQASLCSSTFLLDALKLCSQCDMQYRVSKNSRLLIECCLIQISALGTEKKKSDDIAIAAPANINTTVSSAATPVAQQQVSLPSIKVKGEEIIKKEEKKPFSLETLQQDWQSTTQRFRAIRDGQSLADIMAISMPIISGDNQIECTVYTEEQKEQLQARAAQLLNGMSKRLILPDNIQLHIIVSDKPEDEIKPQPEVIIPHSQDEDVFEEMVQINPALLVLKQQFKLEFRA